MQGNFILMSRRKFWITNEQSDLILLGLANLFCSEKINEAARKFIGETSQTILQHKAKRNIKWEYKETLENYSPNNRKNNLRRMNYKHNPKCKERRLLSGKTYAKEHPKAVKRRQKRYREKKKQDKIITL